MHKKGGRKGERERDAQGSASMDIEAMSSFFPFLPIALIPACEKSTFFRRSIRGENRATTGCRKVSNLVNGERPGVCITPAPLRRWPRCAQRDCRSAVLVDPRAAPLRGPARSPRGWPTSLLLLLAVTTRRVDGDARERSFFRVSSFRAIFSFALFFF